MLKTIAQLHEEKLAALEYTPLPEEATRQRMETMFSFWARWLSVMKPLSGGNCFGYLRSAFDFAGRSSYNEVAAGMKSMKQALGVERLNFNTYFILRGILADACKRALDEADVDIALCAVMAFAQLELGGELDPSYGLFPERKYLSKPDFDDADLSDDPLEAAYELQLRHEGPDFIDYDFRSALWFGRWEKVLTDRGEFEHEFPGAKASHDNLLRVVKPIFERLDPEIDSSVLGNFLRWVDPLLRNPLQQRLSRREPPAKAA